MTDITATKHGGNANSKAAFGEGKDTERKRVYEAIVRAGSDGLTCSELATKLGKDQSKISGRFSELKREGLIVEIGERPTPDDNPAAVCVAAQFALAV